MLIEKWDFHICDKMDLWCKQEPGKLKLRICEYNIPNSGSNFITLKFELRPDRNTMM